MTRWTSVVREEDLTEEILGAAEAIYDGWYSHEPRVDWHDFLDRLDGAVLSDGTRLDLGNDMMSSAVRAVKKHITRYQKL